MITSKLSLSVELTAERQEQIRAVANKLEASFLSEMLKASGLGETNSSYSGGAGEAHFASFARDAHATHFVQAGGIGLSEAFVQSIMEMEGVTE